MPSYEPSGWMQIAKARIAHRVRTAGSTTLRVGRWLLKNAAPLMILATLVLTILIYSQMRRSEKPTGFIRYEESETRHVRIEDGALLLRIRIFVHSTQKSFQITNVTLAGQPYLTTLAALADSNGVLPRRIRNVAKHPDYRVDQVADGINWADLSLCFLLGPEDCPSGETVVLPLMVYSNEALVAQSSVILRMNGQEKK